MLQSRYKFSRELTAKASKLNYKTQTKRKELFINIAVPIAIILMVAILVYDCIKNNNIVFDIILLVLLLFAEVMNFVMPLIIYKSQMRYLQKLEQLSLDYCIAEYDKGKFREKYYKDKQMIYLNEIDANKFSGFLNYEHYIFIFFNNYATLIFDLNEMEDRDKQELNKLISTLSALPKVKTKKR